MRGMMELIGVMVVLIIGVAVVVPVITEVSKEANLSELPGGASISFIINLLPLFIGIAMIFVIVGMFPFGDLFHGSSDDDEDDAGDKDVEEADPESLDEVPVVHDKTKERIWSEELLKRRYARGELTDEEFTEKMSRL